MPLFIIERQYAEELEVDAEVARFVNEINAEEGVRWVYSFLSADNRKTFCVYEAPDPDALRAAAAKAGIPADAIVEIGARITNEGALEPVE